MASADSRKQVSLESYQNVAPHLLISANVVFAVFVLFSLTNPKTPWDIPRIKWVSGIRLLLSMCAINAFLKISHTLQPCVKVIVCFFERV